MWYIYKERKLEAEVALMLLVMCRVYQLSGSCLSFLMFSDRRSPLEFLWLLYNRTRRPSRGPASPILEEILRSLRHWMVHYKSPQTAPVPRSGLPPIIQSSVARSGQVSADCSSHGTPGQVRSLQIALVTRPQVKSGLQRLSPSEGDSENKHKTCHISLSPSSGTL